MAIKSRELQDKLKAALEKFNAAMEDAERDMLEDPPGYVAIDSLMAICEPLEPSLLVFISDKEHTISPMKSYSMLRDSDTGEIIGILLVPSDPV